MTDNNNNSPHSNTFLKNLSQKKYAWMEEASSITTPPFPANKPNISEPKLNAEASPRQQQQSSPKKTKKQKLSPEPEIVSPYIPKKQKYIKSPPSSNNMIQEMLPIAQSNYNLQEMKVETTIDENTVNKQVEDIKPRKPQPHFKYTTFPVKGYNILPTRNITSTFARNDITYFPGNKAGAEEISPYVSLDMFSLYNKILRIIIARGRMERHDYYSSRIT